MKFFVALLALVAVANAVSFEDLNIDAHFRLFKSRFGRVYANPSEEHFRREIFKNNLNFITAHNNEFNAGRKTFLVAVNNFTDLMNEEFRGRMNGLRVNAFQARTGAQHIDNEFEALPATVDWRTKGIVTPIKNQEQCGSCWAFSAVASIESQHALKTGALVSLSEQNLVDCSGAEGNMGCEGGLMDQAFQYVIANKGIDTESSYPYEAVDESCEFKRSAVGATIRSYVDVKQYSESALKSAVATIGPISVGIDASQLSFQFYSSGVYDEPACSTTQLDHGVTAVGYGTLNGTPYWLVKNSWGTSWGEAGYIQMSRNKQNQCGIATAASYPIV